MEEWKTYKLGEICIKIGSGATPKGGKEAYLGGDTSLIRSQNVLDFSFSWDGLAYINEDQASKLDGVEIERNDVLLNITGDSVARACIVPDDALPARVNQHVAIIRGNHPMVLDEYILYFVQFKKQNLLSLSQGGATRNALTKGMIENLDILLPELSEQKKIISILKSLDEKIGCNRRLNDNFTLLFLLLTCFVLWLLKLRNDNLEQQAQALFKSWFVDFEPFKDGEFVESEMGMIPKGWRMGMLSELGEIVGGSTPSKAKSQYYTENGIAWLTPKDLSISPNKFTARGETDITQEGYDSCSTKMMPKGSVLFSSRAPIGYITIAKNDICTNQGFKSVVPKLAGTAFIYYFLKHSTKEIENKATGSTFKEASGSLMKSLPTIIPTKPVLDSFEEIMKPIFMEQETIEGESRRLAQLRDTLLPRLMSGELKVNELERTVG